VHTLEDLGARWEHASVLGERGLLRRLQRRYDDAVRDLRAALALVRELKDRVLVSWTIRELLKALLEMGDRDEARRLFVESESELVASEPGSRSMPLEIAALIALLDGDRDRALAMWLEVVDLERAAPWKLAADEQVWFVGRVFGPDAVGAAEVDAARDRLERARWRQALEEPDRVLTAVRSN
jgi:tetratricopeptide (TPR) repeat protein